MLAVNASGSSCRIWEQGTKARLRRAFVDAIGARQLPVGTAALIPLSLNVVANAEPRVEGSLVGTDRLVVVQVDDRWLHQVWGTGAAVIDGQLVLALAPDPQTSETRTPDPQTPESPTAGVGHRARYRAKVIRWPENRTVPVIASVAVVAGDGRWRGETESSSDRLVP